MMMRDFDEVLRAADNLSDLAAHHRRASSIASNPALIYGRVLQADFRCTAQPTLSIWD
jgi:hypothetical protein